MNRKNVFLLKVRQTKTYRKAYTEKAHWNSRLGLWLHKSILFLSICACKVFGGLEWDLPALICLGKLWLITGSCQVQVWVNMSRSGFDFIKWAELFSRQEEKKGQLEGQKACYSFILDIWLTSHHWKVNICLSPIFLIRHPFRALSNALSFTLTHAPHTQTQAHVCIQAWHCSTICPTPGMESLHLNFVANPLFPNFKSISSSYWFLE